MEQSTIAIILLIIAVILYMTELFPLCVTALLSACAMVFLGVLSWSDVFACMGSNVVVLIIFMTIMGEALLRTGFVTMFCNKLCTFSDKLSEKRLLLVVYVLAAVATAAFHPNAVLCFFLPVLDELIRKSNGRFTRKHTYMVLAVASVYGSLMTIVGTSSMLTGVSLLAASSFKYQLGFFEPAKIGIAGFLAGLLAYATYGYKWQKKCFTFEETTELAKLGMVENIAEVSNQAPWKKWFVFVLLVGGIVCMASGANIGGVSLVVALICMAAKCIKPQEAFVSVDWAPLYVVIGTTAFAKGLDVSGAGRIISDAILNACGPLGENAFAMCVVICFISASLSELMSNNGTVAITVPIGLAIAENLGASGVAFALAGTIGANLAISTPVCCGPFGIVSSAGYRFMDYVKANGPLNIMAFIFTCIALKIVYF